MLTSKGIQSGSSPVTHTHVHADITGSIMALCTLILTDMLAVFAVDEGAYW